MMTPEQIEALTKHRVELEERVTAYGEAMKDAQAEHKKALEIMTAEQKETQAELGRVKKKLADDAKAQGMQKGFLEAPAPVSAGGPSA